MRVAVTGGSGKVGRAVVRELIAHNHSVRNIDRVPDPEPVCGFRRVDLEDLGHTFEAFDGCDAVVHLAATTLRGDTEHETFRSNLMSTFNVFSVACQLKMRRVVWASSETALGLPLDDTLPYLPLDEEPPPVAKSSVRALEGARRRDRALLQRASRRAVCRSALLQRLDRR